MSGVRYGHEALGLFLLDPGVLHLNHGSFGAVTRQVFEAQTRLRQRMETRTSHFFRSQYPELMRSALASAAGAFGGDAGDWAFVENATAGCNTVIASIPWRPGDEVVITSQIYGAVRKALMHHAVRAGAKIVEVPVRFPVEGPEALLAAIGEALGDNTRLAIFDHVTSPGALILPGTEIAALCRARGVPVLIDGAHAAGMMPLDAPALGADWYTLNGHKWLCAPKGCGLLWAAPGRQDGLHPLTISHGYGQGLRAEFDWTGTRDATAQMVLPEVLEAFAAMGGPAVMAHNRALAREAGAVVAGILGSQVMAPDGMYGAMSVVRIRVSGSAEPDRLNTEFSARYPVDAAFVPVNEGLGVRLSAHVYNTPDDYQRLAVWLAEFFGLKPR